MTYLKKFKMLNWLQYNFLLIGHTVKIAEKTGLLELSRPLPTQKDARGTFVPPIITQIPQDGLA